MPESLDPITPRPASRLLLVLTVVFFFVSFVSFAYAGYLYLGPAGSRESSGSALVSPVDFFGQANRETEVKFDERQEKTVPSPLNGILYTEEEAGVWRSRRPLAVMINNHVDARPPWGLSQADIVYEAVAEGGISRFLAIFHAQLPVKVGPVRSARRYYVDWAKEYDAWYAHWGGAATANEANVYDYMRTIFVSSLDEMWAGSGADLAFDRDLDRADTAAWEHTGFARPERLYELAYRQYSDQVREFRPITAWKFKDDLPQSERPEGGSVSFNFWDLPDFLVRWEYDPDTNSYRRFQGGQAQLEALDGEPSRAKNVVVVFMTETALLDDKAHLLYKTLGKGVAKIFLDGQVIEASWSRPDLTSRTRFFDKTGAEVSFNRGSIWIEVLPVGNTLTFN